MRNINRAVLFVLLFAAMLILGLVENIRGVSFPLLKAEFGLSHDRHGFFVSMLSLAGVASGVMAGIFLGRFGTKLSVITGYVAICLGLLLVFFMPGFFPVAAAFFIFSGGLNFLDLGMNALASKVFVTKAALLMNLLHSFYGIGAMIGPRAAGFVVEATGGGWRYAYLFSLPLVLAFFMLTAFTRFPGNTGGGGEGTDTAVRHTGFFDTLRSPLMWLLALSLGLALVVEANTSIWGPLYFQDVHGLSPVTEGAAFLSTFFLLFTLSRLGCGFFVEKIGYVRTLIIAAVITLAVFAVGFSLGARGILVLPALGFFVALFWPTIMAVAIVSFGREAPVYTGAIIAIAGLINAVIQFVIGLTNRVLGPAWGYRSTMVYTLLLIFALIVLYRTLRRKNVAKV